MKRISILVLILCACFVSVAWGQQPAAKGLTNWRQFHRRNMERWNPYEKVLNVHNVGRIGLKWSYSIGGGVFSPAVANGVVYVGYDNAPYGGVYALKASTGALLWSYPLYGGYSSPTVVSGVVYVGSEDYGGGNNVYALNARTGTLLWSYPAGWVVWSSPAVANGVVYVGSNDNNVYALNARTGALLWSYTTGGEASLSSPAVVNGAVYFGSGDGKVYAFGLKKGRK